MIKILRYIKPYILFAILAPLCMFVEVICEISLPLIMSDIMNIGGMRSSARADRRSAIRQQYV